MQCASHRDREMAAATPCRCASSCGSKNCLDEVRCTEPHGRLLEGASEALPL